MTTLQITGLVLQLGAGAYMVFQALRTARALRSMKVSIDSIGDDVGRIGREMTSQFAHQLGAFLVLSLGAVLQAVG